MNKMIPQAPDSTTGMRKDLIQGLATDGQGVVRTAGSKTVFMPFVLPHEVVSFEIIETRSKFERARPVTIHKPSPGRVNPVCSHFGICGSCQLQHADFALQSKIKKEWFLETCRRIGRWPDTHIDSLPSILETVSLKEHQYRQRVRFHFCVEKTKEPKEQRQDFHLGFRAQFQNQHIVHIENCQTAVPEISRVRQPLLDVLAFHAKKKSFAEGNLQIELTRYFDHEKQCVSLAMYREGRDRLPVKNQILEACLKDLKLHGIQNPQYSKGEKDFLLIQPEPCKSYFSHKENAAFFTESMAPFLVHRLGFLQPHCEAAPVYRNIVLQILKTFHDNHHQNLHVWDLFGGSGLFTTCTLSPSTGFRDLNPSQKLKVTHNELSRESVLAAQENLKSSISENLNPNIQLSFAPENASAFLKKSAAKKILPNFVIADPPRTGLGIKDATLLSELLVQSKGELALICCDPAAFARDALIFFQAGFRLKRMVLVDAFPQTRHYECVAHFSLDPSASGSVKTESRSEGFQNHHE